MGLNVHVIECDFDPNVPPTAVGAHWVNTATGCQFFANGTSSVGDWQKLVGDTDELVGVSANDSTPGYLVQKLVAGTGITLTEQNDGGNETLEISGPASGETNDGVNLGAGSQVFESKSGVNLQFRTLVAGPNVTLTQNANTIEIEATDTDDDENVKVSANDTTAGTLLDKIQAGSNITITENNNGGNETLTIAATAEISGNVAAVQVEQSSTSVIPNTYTDINYGSIHVENDDTVLERDNANLDRVLVKETGFYEISYSAGIITGGASTGYDMRVRTNDAVVIPGSQARIEHESDEDWIGHSFVAELSAGDFVSVQIQEDTGGAAQGAVLEIAHLSVVALKGAKGDKGDTGPAGGVDSVNGQTGIVTLSAADVSALPDSTNLATSGGIQGGGLLSSGLNLSLTDTAVSPGSFTNANVTVDQKGRITAISNGAGGSSVFGQNAEDFIDLTNVAYTTNTPFLAYDFTTGVNPAGRYRVALNLHYEPGATNANDIFTLRIDGTQIGLEFEDEGKDTGGDIRKIVELKGYYQHTSAGTFDIQLWASQDGGGTTVIHGVQAEVWRVS